MKIKLDENLPVRLTTLLKDIGHDVHAVQDERLVGRADNEIWEAAQRESRFLITQDLDFSDARRFVPGSHHGILLVRLHSPNRRNLVERMSNYSKRKPSANGLAVLWSPQNARFASSGPGAGRIPRTSGALMKARRKRRGTDHDGSSLDSFLEEEGMRTEVEAVAIKRVLEWRRRPKQHRAVAVKTKRA